MAKKPKKPKKKQYAQDTIVFQDDANFTVEKSMALTITSNLTTVDDADSVTGWGVIGSDISAGWGVNSDEGVQGSVPTCISGQNKNATARGIIYYDNGSDIDLTSEWLRIWLRFTEIGKMASSVSTAGPGAGIYVEDSSNNWGIWGIGGDDGGVSEAWTNYAIDTEIPFSVTSGTPIMTAIRRIGISVKMDTKPAKADNIFIDAIRYGDSLTITGTNTFVGDGWAEIADADEAVANQYGIFRRDQTGNYVLKGKLIFGDSGGTGSVDFSDNKNSKIFIPNGVEFFQTSNYAGSYLSGRDDLGIVLVGNATGTTDFELGSLLGTGDDRQGILGGSISSLGFEPYIFDAETDTSDIDSCNLYGVTFEGAGNIILAGATTQEAIGCTFIACDEIQANTVEFLNNKIITPVDRGLELLNGNDIKQIDFIAAESGDLPIDSCIAAKAVTALTRTGTRENTDDANNDTADDVDILGTSILVNDAAGYFGFRSKFGHLKINTSTARVGGTVAWQYYNGTTWPSLTVITDDTNLLTTTGEQDLIFDPPSDWAKFSPSGSTAHFYIRIAATANRTTNPLLQRVKVTDVLEHGVHCPTAGTIDATDLNFSGYTAAPGYPKYNIENSSNATTEDSYSDTNQDATQALGNGTIEAVGQSITGAGGVMSRLRVDLSKTLSPTGNLVAKVYAHSGTFGTSSVPTGAALATSNTIDVADLTTTLTLTDLEFEDEFTLVNTTKYVVTLEYDGGDGSNFVNVGTDTSSPTHGGNFSTSTGTWSAVAGTDMIFFAYTGGIVKLTAVGGNPATDDNTGVPPGATIIDQSVNILIKAIDAKTLGNVQDARVYLTAAAGGPLTEGTTILTPASQLTNASGEVSDTFSFTSNQPVIGWVRRSTTTPLYSQSPLVGTITNEGLSLTAALVSDES